MARETLDGKVKGVGGRRGWRGGLSRCPGRMPCGGRARVQWFASKLRATGPLGQPGGGTLLPAYGRREGERKEKNREARDSSVICEIFRDCSINQNYLLLPGLK